MKALTAQRTISFLESTATPPATRSGETRRRRFVPSLTPRRRPTHRFVRRGWRFQDLVLAQLVCPSCRNERFGASQVFEYEEDGAVFYESDCARCGRRCEVSFAELW